MTTIEQILENETQQDTSAANRHDVALSQQGALTKGVSTSRILSNAVGMTIVEIMIVLTIIASLMAVIGFYAFGYLDSANTKEAQIAAKRLSDNVSMYYMTSSPKSLPGSLKDLTKGATHFVDKIDPDPWGNEYIYTKRGNRDFEIRSAGPDGQPNTSDDICADGPCSDTSE